MGRFSRSIIPPSGGMKLMRVDVGYGDRGGSTVCRLGGSHCLDAELLTLWGYRFSDATQPAGCGFFVDAVMIIHASIFYAENSTDNRLIGLRRLVEIVTSVVMLYIYTV